MSLPSSFALLVDTSNESSHVIIVSPPSLHFSSFTHRHAGCPNPAPLGSIYPPEPSNGFHLIGLLLRNCFTAETCQFPSETYLPFEFHKKQPASYITPWLRPLTYLGRLRTDIGSSSPTFGISAVPIFPSLSIIYSNHYLS